MRKILKYTDAVFTASRHNADCSANFKILIFFFEVLRKVQFVV
jgi:hypothetical protein